MHFQPVIALADGSVHAFEALARWRHPSRGLLSAAEFIPVAEESGLIVDLGRDIMQAACAQAGQWQDAAPAGRHIGLWINVSPAQFGNERLVDDLAVAITTARIDPQQVTVEVTESSVIRDARQSTETLHRLRALGVSVSIDDFGTGYSSLSRLGELPIDMLKIPKPFVDRLAGDAPDSAIVDAILRLASSLGLTAVAEGAETQEQVDRLQELGCALVQGYVFGRAESADDTLRFLRHATPDAPAPHISRSAARRPPRHPRPPLACRGHVHLQSIRIRGFKSFVEPVELKLEPGVAVVVGPNGSGKSNVADAIVWAAGSLTPSELRAEKPDDVLFGGSSTRQAADHCEVELLFDNGDGGFGEEIDFDQIAITRRLVRGGEGQYLVNKAAVRRTDLVELLADVGLGGSMHSIVSQGKVDAVLASQPEDRRHLVEEAAGLGKFKRRKHRAELKLARVATQVERAKDVEEEVRKRLRPLALQATAAERAEKLAVEIAALRARDRAARPRGGRRAPRGRRGAPRRRSRSPGAARRRSCRAARGAAAGRGRALRCGGRPRGRRSAPSTACRARASASRCGASRRPA